MSQSVITAIPPGGTALQGVLEQNRETYDNLAPLYESSGRARLAQAKRWLRPLLAPLRRSSRRLSILELGSADGYLAGYIGALGHEVTTVEFAAGMVEATRRNAPLATVVEADFLDVDLPGGYDIVLCSAFAHLFPAPWDRLVIGKAAKLLTPEGLVYAATTLHAEDSGGYEVKADGLRRYRQRYTASTFTTLITCSGLAPEHFYVTRDRLAPSKTWGNWLARGSGS